MNELEWLVEECPQVRPPTARVTARAREALVAHMAPPRRASRRRRRRPVLAGLAIAAAAVVVAALPRAADDTLAPPRAVAAPLVRLSQRIAAEPAPSGDATLVLRTHVFPNAPGFTGADLYLDDGRYYYAPTRAGLGRDSLVNNSSDRALAAALAALRLPPDEARERMIAATWAPGAKPPPASRTLDDNRVWMGATDALLAGAGRKDVRAGAMALLATIKTVRAEAGTEEGHAVLRLTATDYPDHYEETFVVDAVSGVIRRMVGGTAGERPDVTVTYEITRVDAARVLSSSATP